MHKGLDVIARHVCACVPLHSDAPTARYFATSAALVPTDATTARYAFG